MDTQVGKNHVKGIADLEKVKQLEPGNTDVYLYLAQATAFRGEMEASKGNLEARVKSQEEAIELLKEGIKATNDDVKASINFLDMKHNFSFAQAGVASSDQKKQLLEMEPEYLSLTAKFGSKAEVFSALASFYSDYRLGPAYLDKAIEAAEKAVNSTKMTSITEGSPQVCT